MLDTSVLVSFFVEDSQSERAEEALSRVASPVVSDFAASEFASGVAAIHRTKRLSRNEAWYAFRAFDMWRVARAEVVALRSEDIALATTWLRRLDLNLRAPDALHLAMASRLRLPLLTFDAGMATAARALNLLLADA